MIFCQSIFQALATGAILVINRCLHDYARSGLARHIRDLQVHITIETDESGILQICSRNVIQDEFLSSARCGIERVGAQRPCQNLRHCRFNWGNAGQRDMFFRMPEIL
jgi:hypothetical protein